MTTAIIYFVKYPEAGRVKTRLAKTVGDQSAVEIYRELAFKNFSRIKDLDADIKTAVFYDPPDAELEIRQWLSGADFYCGQAQGGLGTRLKEAVNWAFDEADNILLAGSDTLKLTAEILRDALHTLECFDTVLGPAEDGGYYLFGMNEPLQSVFDEIDWSTEHVLVQTKTRLDSLCLSYGELDLLADLDEWPEDKSKEEIYELIRI